MGLTCVMLVAITGSSLADSVTGSSDADLYQYWHPPAESLAAYRRQYGYDTSPNPANMLDEPGVAVALLASGAGVSFTTVYHFYHQ